MELSVDIENYGLALSDDDPVGEDPRYLDEFDLIRSEIEKMAGNDFELIANRSRYILLEQSKDLRVGGYLLLALTYLSGVNGLIEGLSIYNEMLASFGATLHPLRPSAKASAIKWLNNAKLEAYIQKETLSDIAIVTQLKSLIETLNTLIEKSFPEIQSRFFIANAWLKKQNIEPVKKENIGSSFMKQLLPQTKVVEKKENLVIEDEKDFMTTSRSLFRYCQLNSMHKEQINIARMMRWSSNFKVPVHKNYKSQLPFLRKEGIDELTKLFNGNDPTALFNQSESAFLDSGGQYYLDLQYYSYCALKKLSKTSAISALIFHVSDLIKKHPELISLKFNDDTPFASEQTKLWLANLNKTVAKEAPAKTASNFKSNVDFVKQAQRQSLSEELSSQINTLKSIPANSSRECIEKDFAIAKLLSLSKKELAGIHYQTLAEQIKEENLDKWLPELAIDVLKSYKNLLTTLPNSNNELKKIMQWLCKLDPVACF